MKWIALDTETYKGKAFLLSDADRVYRINSFDNFVQALSGHGSGSRFAFYNMDYDVTGLIKYLPHEICKHLYLDRGVTHKDYFFRYIPGKLFKIRKGKQTYEIYDLFPFYQTSLDAAAKKYLGIEKKVLPPEIDIKNLSPIVYKLHRITINSYARHDAYIAQLLLDLVIKSIYDTGLKVKALFSPGYIAKRYLKKKKLTPAPLLYEHKAIVDNIMRGGRIEVLQRGSFEDVIIYDIKSAYPAALASLPDLSRAVWSKSKYPDSEWFIERVFIHDCPNGYFSPIPHRDKPNGMLYFPNLSRRDLWITNFEHDSFLKYGISFEPLECYNLYPPRDYIYRDLIYDLYQRRNSGAAESLIYKLILNSLYGIFAEKRKEYKPVEPHVAYNQFNKRIADTKFEQLLALLKPLCPEVYQYYANKCRCDVCRSARIMAKKFRIYGTRKHLLSYEDNFYSIDRRDGFVSNRLMAAFVTAYTRKQIFDFGHALGENLLACFTDSVIFSSGASFNSGLQFGKNLGNWDFEYSGPCILIGSGVYETNAKNKFRGFTLRDGLSLNTILRNMPGATRKIPQRDRVSLARYVTSSYTDWSELNVISEISKNFNLNFDTKRIWERNFINGYDVLKNRINSRPFNISY